MELRKLAKNLYPNTYLSPAHLLIAWAKQDPDGELSGILTGAGLDTKGVISALTPLLSESDKEDKDILTRCVMSVTEGPVTGRSLLKVLCKSPEYRVTASLVKKGLKLDRFEARLENEGKIARWKS